MPMLDRYVALLIAENSQQNLIARSTEVIVWRRHILDSLQLGQFARASDRTWLDVGSGPGLPGLVLAGLGWWAVTLVEPRRRRAEFLRQVVDYLGMVNVAICEVDVRRVSDRHDLVSARAVASVDRMFELTRGCSDEETRFLLPKGRSAREDVDLAQRKWHGLFHVEQSITDPDAGIVIADRVRPR